VFRNVQWCGRSGGQGQHGAVPATTDGDRAEGSPRKAEQRPRRRLRNLPGGRDVIDAETSREMMRTIGLAWTTIAKRTPAAENSALARKRLCAAFISSFQKYSCMDEMKTALVRTIKKPFETEIYPDNLRILLSRRSE